MRFRRPADEDDAEVPLSPLIDCVFLLLIFFLVTTMFKRYEKQIPVKLPSMNSSVAPVGEEDVAILGLNRDGTVLRDSGRRDEFGAVQYEPVKDLALYLLELRRTRDPKLALRFAAEWDTPFQTVIDALDVAQLQGFTNVEVRTRPESGQGPQDNY